MPPAFAGRLVSLVTDIAALTPVATVAIVRPGGSQRVECTYATAGEVGRLVGPATCVEDWLAVVTADGAGVTSSWPLGSGDSRLWVVAPAGRAPHPDAHAALARLASGLNRDIDGETDADKTSRLARVERAHLVRASGDGGLESLGPVLAALLHEHVPGAGVSIEPLDDELRRAWPASGDPDRSVTTSGPGRCLPHAVATVSTGTPITLRVPVRAADQVMAVLKLTADAGRTLTLADVSVVTRIAEQTALLVLDARLDEARRRNQAFEAQALQLDALLGALAGAHDVRSVFDQVSAICQRVLPHDAMTIVVGGGQLGKVSVYAATGAMSHLPLQAEVPLPNQPLLVSPVDHALVTDLQHDARYRAIPAVRAGMRAMLSMLNRVGGRVHSAVNFLSAEPGRFSQDDVVVARRIASHIGLALAQQRVVDEARQVQILQNRTANLELLDELLKTISESHELSEIIERLSDTARKVLPHDGLVLTVYLPDGTHARRYASTGFDTRGMAPVAELPAGLRGSDWDYQTIADLATTPPADMRGLAELGFQSALRMAVRLDGAVAGALTFVSTQSHGFTHDHVSAGRRIAERVALCLARERGVQASRRADEASERAARLEARVRALTDELDARSGYRRVIGESAPWRAVLTQATQVAATDTTVLLLGESGTGKEVVARLLHRGSKRRDAPFVALNCAALPEHLLEAELFGYERGAFTGATQSKPGQLEQASGGVLFLDEVGEMSLPAQAKFLRVLQEREFQRLGGTRVLRTDARIVAATNRDLHEATASRQFREDLFYRLNVFAIRLPPLRERRDDVMPLTQAFLAEFGRTFAHPPAGLSADAREALLAYHWPGNVRELRNILERAAILCDGGVITGEHLALPAPGATGRPLPTPATSLPGMARTPASLETPSPTGDLPTMERSMIEQALQQARFNKSKAARTLGLTRHQLYIRMRRHGLGD